MNTEPDPSSSSGQSRIAGWYALSFATTIQFSRYYLEFFAIVSLAISVISGVFVWRMAGDITLFWDAQGTTAAELLTFEGQTDDLLLVILGLVVVQWLINILLVSFVNEVFELRGTELQPSTFKLLRQATAKYPTYLARILVLLILTVVVALVPGLIISVFIDSFFGITFVLAASIVVNILSLDWVTKAGIEDIRKGLSEFIPKLLRAFGAGITATFILVAIDAIGTLLISVGSLVDRMPSVDPNQDFQIPLRTLLGTNQWALGLRAIFVVLGTTIATAFWVNSRLVQQELDIESI